MMASVDAEADMENLFAGDDVHMDGGVENTQSLTQEEGGLSFCLICNLIIAFSRAAKG